MDKEKLKLFTSQFSVLLKRNCRLFLYFRGGEFLRFIVLVVGPAAVAYTLTWVMNGHFSSQLAMNICALLIMVMAAIYIGTSNSLLIICNEKQILKYEFISGVSPAAYILSEAVVQIGICLLQAAIFTSVYMNRLQLPASDFLLGKNMNWFISFFLILYASDMTGLLLSSLSPSGETANFISPICIIAQILFSGTLWGMDNWLSRCMIARWGMASLGSLIDLGTIDSGLAETLSADEQQIFQTALNAGGYSWEKINALISERMIQASGIDVSIYQQNGGYVLSTWGYLLCIIVVLILINIFVVRIVKFRKR